MSMLFSDRCPPVNDCVVAIHSTNVATLFPGIREIHEDRSVSRRFLTILARFTGWDAR